MISSLFRPPINEAPIQPRQSLGSINGTGGGARLDILDGTVQTVTRSALRRLGDILRLGDVPWCWRQMVGRLSVPWPVAPLPGARSWRRATPG
jgi:hypothetical protein